MFNLSKYRTKHLTTQKCPICKEEPLKEGEFMCNYCMWSNNQSKEIKYNERYRVYDQVD